MLPKLVVVSSLLMIAGGSVREPSPTADFFDSTAGTWIRCLLSAEPSRCLEERTIRQLRDLTPDPVPGSDRGGKVLDDGSVADDPGTRLLQSENAKMLASIRSQEPEPRGLIDYIADFFANGIFKSFDGVLDFGDDEDDEEDEKSEGGNDAETAIKGRGHKKKYLKKQNKHLKLILILMLIKNKIKMFLHKFQFLVQLKFLGIALANLLINAIRLYLELKKKHRPNKVIYYEKSHHQHHYDNEHIHDDGDDHIHYSRPGSYTHHAHYEDEHEGGGIWPWSRSYVERKGDSYGNHQPGMSPHYMAYANQRPIR